MPVQQQNACFGKGFQGAANRNSGGGFRLGNSRTGPDSALAQNAPAIRMSQNPEGWRAEGRTEGKENGYKRSADARKDRSDLAANPPHNVLEPQGPWLTG